MKNNNCPYARKSRVKLSVIAWLSIVFCGVSWSQDEKYIIAAVEQVYLVGSGLHFVSRIDTGAKTSSVNAEKIHFVDGFVEYVLLNAEGKRAFMRSPVVKKSIVRNAESTEMRVFVWLTIEYNGVAKKTLVNLNNRSSSDYKMLLGRNWLSGDFIVDVDKQ